MGNTVIKEGDIQAMSAGTGIFTASTINKDQLVKFYRFDLSKKKCNASL
jgi:hypothetical protein